MAKRPQTTAKEIAEAAAARFARASVKSKRNRKPNPKNVSDAKIVQDEDLIDFAVRELNYLRTNWQVKAAIHEWQRRYYPNCKPLDAWRINDVLKRAKVVQAALAAGPIQEEVRKTLNHLCRTMIADQSVRDSNRVKAMELLANISGVLNPVLNEDKVLQVSEAVRQAIKSEAELYGASDAKATKQMAAEFGKPIPGVEEDEEEAP